MGSMLGARPPGNGAEHSTLIRERPFPGAAPPKAGEGTRGFGGGVVGSSRKDGDSAVAVPAPYPLVALRPDPPSLTASAAMPVQAGGPFGIWAWKGLFGSESSTGCGQMDAYLVTAGPAGGFSPSGPTAIDTLTVPSQFSVIRITHVFSGLAKLR